MREREKKVILRSKGTERDNHRLKRVVVSSLFLLERSGV